MSKKLLRAVNYMDTEVIDTFIKIASIDAHSLIKHDLSETVAGIYFLFSGNELVYIGKSKDISSRVLTHKGTKDYDQYAFMPCQEELLSVYERVLINKYNPKYNQDPVTKAIRRIDAGDE